MKRFAVVFRHNGRKKTKGVPFNFYGESEEQIRSHFASRGYGIESVRMCSTLTD